MSKEIEKAMLSCFNSGNRIENHFVNVTKMTKIGKDGPRSIKTVPLSRYACGPVTQNPDLKKEIVAHGQTYFVIRMQHVGHEQEIGNGK